MQRYTDKVYSRAHQICESPLSLTNQQHPHLENSFSVSSDTPSLSMELSLGLPLTITKEKCKNCQRLEKSLGLLTNQLLAIERNILQKEQRLGDLLAEKTQIIDFLQAKLDNINEKAQVNHFSSTFYTEAEQNHSKLPSTLGKKLNQQNYPSFSLISEKKIMRHSFVSVFSVDVLPYKIRQKTQKRQLNQNVSPNSQNSAKDKLLNQLKFENETLKNYNSSLLVQLQKTKRRH